MKNKNKMTLTQDQIDELKKIIDKALDELYNEEPSLISSKVNERSIAFRLGIYIETLKNNSKENKEYKYYDLDVEYNKNQDDFKKVPSKPNGAIPDLILHKRGNNWNNLLIIEIKRPKNYTGRNDDREKLKDFTNRKGDYIYGLGVFIILGNSRDSVKLEYFINNRFVQ